MPVLPQLLGLFLDVYTHFLFSPIFAGLGLWLGLSVTLKGHTLRPSHGVVLLALLTLWGVFIIAAGLWSVGGETNPTPSYLHGLVCVYAFGAALLTMAVVGAILAHAVRGRPWFARLETRFPTLRPSGGQDR